MRVARIADETSLEPLRPEWNALSEGVPFRSWKWLHPWWNHYGANRELFVLTVRNDDGTLVGLAPWLIEKQKVAGRVIQFLGAGDVCSDHLGLLVDPKQENQVVRALASWLLRHAGDKGNDHWDSIRLEGVTDRGTSVRKLAVRLREGGCAVHRRNLMNGWRLRLPNGWEDLTATLGKSTRRNVKQYAKRMRQNDRIVLEQATAPDRFQQALETLVDLHQRRRNSLGQAGCFNSRSFTEFIQDVSRLMLPTGQLQLPVLKIDGQPAACQLNLVQQHATYHYQGGIDPEFLKQSPGGLLMTAMLQRAIDEGHTQYDFLRGDEPYKANWRAEPYPVWEFRIAANKLGPQLVHRAWQSVAITKNWLKKGSRPATESNAATTRP